MSSYPIDMSLAVILLFIVVGWLCLNSLLFSIRDSGRMMRERKRMIRHEEIQVTMQRPEVKRMGSKIKLNAAGPQVAMLRKSRNLNLGFRELTVDITDGKSTKRIIDNVSGDIRAGRLTAVMGPSGAGATSEASRGGDFAISNANPLATMPTPRPASLVAPLSPFFPSILPAACFARRARFPRRREVFLPARDWGTVEGRGEGEQG
jgi:hypothetical protein